MGASRKGLYHIEPSRRSRLPRVVKLKENMENNQPTVFEKLFSKRNIFAGIFAITVGIIASGLYDMLVKPGINRFSDWSYNIFSKFSESIENSPFSSAALDPTAIPSLFILLFACSFIIGIFFGAIVFSWLFYFKKTISQKINNTKAGKYLNSFYFPFTFLIMYFLIISAVLTMLISVTNKSISIHRVFYANMAICSPYIDPNERAEIISEFAKMENKFDYIKINERLIKIAEQNKISLRKEQIK